MRIPAVVGSFPEPFLSGRGGKKLPVRLDCAPDSERACDEVRLRLEAAGVKGTARQTIGQAPQTGLLRVVVGRWTDVRRDAAARRIDRGPGESGVFARFTPDGRRLELLDARGRPVRALAGGSGLVAATAFAEQAPTWVVTGTDDVGVAAAAGALTEDGLRDHFAVAVERGRGIGLPVRPAGTP
jgi:hypothetical protein